jgi:hypothetical protein
LWNKRTLLRKSGFDYTSIVKCHGDFFLLLFNSKLLRSIQHFKVKSSDSSQDKIAYPSEVSTSNIHCPSNFPNKVHFFEKYSPFFSKIHSSMYLIIGGIINVMLIPETLILHSCSKVHDIKGKSRK